MDTEHSSVLKSRLCSRFQLPELNWMLAVVAFSGLNCNIQAPNTKLLSEVATRTLLWHLPDRIEDDITLQADNSLNESGSKLTWLPKTTGRGGRETADSGCRGETAHTLQRRNGGWWFVPGWWRSRRSKIQVILKQISTVKNVGWWWLTASANTSH